jgi:hypothetical protein
VTPPGNTSPAAYDRCSPALGPIPSCFRTGHYEQRVTRPPRRRRVSGRVRMGEPHPHGAQRRPGRRRGPHQTASPSAFPIPAHRRISTCGRSSESSAPQLARPPHPPGPDPPRTRRRVTQQRLSGLWAARRVRRRLYARRRRTVNRQPPGSLRTAMSPSNTSTRPRAIASPSPVPPVVPGVRAASPR